MLPVNTGEGRPRKRSALVDQLRKTGLQLELFSGGRTQWNRVQGSIPRTHALDAARVGGVGCLHDWRKPVLQIGCAGRGPISDPGCIRSAFPVRGADAAKQVREMVPSVATQRRIQLFDKERGRLLPMPEDGGLPPMMS